MKSDNMSMLIPVDFSDESLKGLSTGIEIAKTGHGKITILNVVTELEHMIDHYYESFENVSVAYRLGHEKLEKEKNKIEKELIDLAHKYGIKNSSLNVHVTSGFYRDVLKEYLSENEVDLIVMGTDGRSTLFEFFTETRIEQSIRIAQIPILAVKKHYSPKAFKKLLLGVELKEYNPSAVNQIKLVAEYLGMEISIVHVKESTYEEKEDSLKLLDEFVGKYNLPNADLHVIKEGEAYRRLSEFAGENNYDIIATISSGHNAFLKLLFGSNTENIIKFTERPVLAVID